MSKSPLYAAAVECVNELVDSRRKLLAENRSLRMALARLVEWSGDDAKDSPDCSGWIAAFEHAQLTLAETAAAHIERKTAALALTEAKP